MTGCKREDIITLAPILSIKSPGKEKKLWALNLDMI